MTLHLKRRDALTLGTTAVFGATALFVTSAHAATYPDTLIKLVLPYAPGGSTDLFARIVAEGMTKRLGQTVIVDNWPGSNGMIGIDAVMRAPPDGYTVLFSLTSVIQNPLLYTSVKYDPFKDIQPVSELGRMPTVLVVGSQVQASTPDQFVKLARAKPGEYSYATTGVGGSSHLYGEMLQDAAKIQLLHVPYKGEAQAINDLLGGQVSAAFISARSAAQHTATGKMRPLAVVGKSRAPLATEVPTFAEQGFADMDAVGWFALYPPQGTPRDITNKLQTTAHAVVNDPAMAGRIGALSIIPNGSTPEALLSSMRFDYDRWARIIKAKNIRLD